MVELDDTVELSMLYDFYGDLLGEHKKEIFEAYVLCDLTLAEVAEKEGITRQGVHDLVKNCARKLREYESVLHLVSKYHFCNEKCDEIIKIAKKIGTPEGTEIVDLVQDMKDNGI